MATRITRPLPPISGRIDAPYIEGNPAPDIYGSGVTAPPNLRKRLTAAVGRLYPGWTIRVTVRSWTATHVEVVIDGTRDPSSGAPPAPAPGSTAAEKLANRTSKVLERLVEKQYPGSDWDSTPAYTSSGQNLFRLQLYADRKVTDPPTCADGTVIYPVSVQESLSGMLSISISNPNPKTNLIPNPDAPDRWVFFHYRKSQPQPDPSSLVAMTTSSSWAPANWFTWDEQSNDWQVLPASVQQPITPPLLQDSTAVQLHATDTFACRLVGTQQLVLNRGPKLADWYVWARP